MIQEDKIPPAIDITDLSITYRGNVRAVDGVSLQIQQGEITALLGPNGAGKTTLLDLALGLAQPDKGSRQILGMDPGEAIRRGTVGVVNQGGALPMDFTVEKTLRLMHSFYRYPLSVGEAMERTNLTSLGRRKIAKLSGGERQRLRLALALLPQPLLLFLDEPTTGMDPSARLDFWKVMSEARQSGLTMVFATHYLAEAENHAERTIIMNRGKIAADAPTAELLRQGKAHLTADLPQSAKAALEPKLVQAGLDYTWSWDHLLISGQALEAAARIVLTAPECANLRITDSSLEEIFSVISNGADEPIQPTTRKSHS